MNYPTRLCNFIVVSLTAALITLSLVLSKRLKTFFAILICLAGLIAVLVLMRTRVIGLLPSVPHIFLEGSVLAANIDPSERTALAGVKVTASMGKTTATSESDVGGYFNLSMKKYLGRDEPVTLIFLKPGYSKVKLTLTKPGDQLYVVQMVPIMHAQSGAARSVKPAKIAMIKDVRVRYTFKDEATVAVGSYAKEFVALNNGNVPCRSQMPCSPDGRWKATVTVLPLEAEQGDEFRNVRVSCIAGPCRFTRLETPAPTEPTRQTSISVLNWSDTADFLVEADVIRSMRSDVVKQSYPFILGDTMNFTMPPNSQGPSVEATVDGQDIVFPLGPELKLDWATCSFEVSQEKNKIYRCQLKPGYQFH